MPTTQKPDGCEATIFIYCVEGEGWAIMKNQQITVPAQTRLAVPAYTPHS